MTTASSSFTSSSRPLVARLASILAWALAGVVAVNALVGVRLEPLLRHYPVDALIDLDARVDRFQARDQVKALVFGNSHVQHGLRPPSAGPAIGLRPDEVFNLALPGATAFEIRLHVQRYLGRFPAARRAFVGVDEPLLTMVPWFHDERIRYLTRFDPFARIRYAGYMPDIEHRVTTVAWLPLPLADFAPLLRSSGSGNWRLMTTRLVMGDIGWDPWSKSARVATDPYRWGYPPRPDVQMEVRRDRAHFYGTRSHHWFKYRANLFYGAPYAIGRSLEDLEAACRALEARGLEVSLIAPILTASFSAYLARERGGEKKDFDATLARYLRTSGRSLVKPAIPHSDANFIDADHLSSEGARLYADAIARDLGWAPARR